MGGGNGQWRRPDGDIDHERAKVLLLVHPNTATARAAVQAALDGTVRSSNRNQCCGSQRAFASPHKCRLRKGHLISNVSRCLANIRVPPHGAASHRCRASQLK